MKTKSFISLGAALVLLSLAASESSAGVSWSVSIFDGPLGACGHWVSRPGTAVAGTRLCLVQLVPVLRGLLDVDGLRLVLGQQ